LQTIEDNIFKRKNYHFTTRSGNTISTGKQFEFCSNNYLGPSSHPEVIKLRKTLWSHGFECHQYGSFVVPKIFKNLEKKYWILRNGRHYSLRCGICQTGVFEPLLEKEMRLSRIVWIMLLLLTGCVCAKDVIVMKIAIWRIWTTTNQSQWGGKSF
jgi:hypothetical protein